MTMHQPMKRGAPARPAKAAAVVQTKLRVGRADDPLEREADVVADAVMRTLGQARGASMTTVPLERTRISRAVRTSPASGGVRTIARQVAPAAIGEDGGPVTDDVERRITAARGNGTPLPTTLGREMEGAFGADFSHVTIHDDAASHELNRSMQAHAFTSRSDIFLGATAPSLASESGTRLLAHELTHVVQQAGPVQRSHADAPDVIHRLTAPADAIVAADRAREALAAHKRDRARLLKIVRRGAKSKDRRTANACEWILDGRTKLYALNPTGDRDERIAHLGENPLTTETWFPEGNGGAGDLQSAVAMYNHLDLDDDTNICVDDDDGPSTNGWNGDGFIAVMMNDGEMAEATVLETLRHEVQHDADKNREKRQAAQPIADDDHADALERAREFEGYKTEYRAYNYQAIAGKGYSKLSPTKVVTKYGFKWSERQLQIFEHIFEGYDHTRLYWDDSFERGNVAEPDTPTDKHTYADPTASTKRKKAIEARRRALVNYLNPDDEGFNKYDSIRVDDFYRALDAVPLNTSSSGGSEVSALMWKTAGLQKKEALYVLEESPDMRKKLKAHLVDQAFVGVYQLLCGVAGVERATPIEQMDRHENVNIQNFIEALSAVPLRTSDPKHAAVKKLRFKTAKFSKKEAKRVLNHEPKLLNQIDLHVRGTARTELMKLLNDCVG